MTPVKDGELSNFCKKLPQPLDKWHLPRYNTRMNDTNTNIGIQLDTLADLLDWAINQYEKVSKKIGNLYEAVDQIYKSLGCDNPAMTALQHELTTLNTECDYWCDLCDKNFERYEDLIDEYLDTHGTDYIPERGADWKPKWFTKESSYQVYES